MNIRYVQFTAVIDNFDVQNKANRRNLEDSLGDFNFTYFGLPVQSSPLPFHFGLSGFPLMTGQSNDNCTQITVFEKNVQVSVVYDKNIFSSRQEYFAYIRDKISIIVKFLEKLSVTYVYSGFTARYLFENFDNAIELLNRNSVRIVSKQPFSNFLKKFSVIYDDKYYVNFEFMTYRDQTNNNRNVSITVDINDRYASEIECTYVDFKNIDVVQSLCEKISEETLQNLLVSGELNLDE